MNRLAACSRMPKFFIPGVLTGKSSHFLLVKGHVPENRDCESPCDVTQKQHFLVASGKPQKCALRQSRGVCRDGKFEDYPTDLANFERTNSLAIADLGLHETPVITVSFKLRADVMHCAWPQNLQGS